MENQCPGNEPAGRLQMMQEDSITVDAVIISSMCYGLWLIEEIGHGQPFNWYSCRWEKDPAPPIDEPEEPRA